MNGEVSSALDFIAKRSPDNGKREHFAVVVADEKNLREPRVDTFVTWENGEKSVENALMGLFCYFLG